MQSKEIKQAVDQRSCEHKEAYPALSGVVRKNRWSPQGGYTLPLAVGHPGGHRANIPPISAFSKEHRKNGGLVRIADIVPYEKNARHNEKAVPAVAESIREFGLRGQIVLESRDKPVIVCGHTRVAACKSLGWDEIPDGNIAYCDGLSEEQIKAFRLADNRTGEIATWNIALLKGEMKGLAGKIDMSRFRFDSKVAKPYGAERLRTDDAYNLRLVNAADCDVWGMPIVKGCMAKPSRMVGFNFAKSMPEDHKRGSCCHFFIDDYQFERVWNTPEKYIDVLRGFDCVLSPDFSLYMDMPYPMQRWNEYRRRVLNLYWQREGLKVVPTLSWTDAGSYTFCLEGLPKRKTVAVSTVGVKGDEAALLIWRAGMSEAMRRLSPSRVLLYGGNVGFDFGSCEVVEYNNEQVFRKGEQS